MLTPEVGRKEGVTMSSILDLARQAMTPDIVRNVGSFIGESPAAAGKGFASAMPSVLAGIVDMGSTPSGAERVQSMISDGGFGSSTLGSLGSLLGGGSATAGLLRSGGHLLSSLFGSRESDVTDAVARSADISSGSAGKLLALAAPIVMAVLGREIGTRGLDRSGLMNLLAGERASVASLLPAGLAGILGYKTPTVPSTVIPERERVRTEPVVTAPTRHVEPVVRERTTSGWGWWPAVAAGLAALALVFFATRYQAPKVAVTDQTVPSAAPREITVPTPPVATAPAPPAVSVPSASVATTPEPAAPAPAVETPKVEEKSSFLTQLTAYLADTSDTTLPKRFVFDDLNFETGTATLTPASQATVDELATILKANPGVQVTLEGHTDSTGNAAANRKLSQDRAAAVKAKLVDEGAIAPERIRTAGFGQERPLTSNDSEDGRARNRRTELVVTRR
jgi:outer membrane protein OmpA-like peptidoglycan-associated protein